MYFSTDQNTYRRGLHLVIQSGVLIFNLMKIKHILVCSNVMVYTINDSSAGMIWARPE